jgi:hypothetical protein
LKRKNFGIALGEKAEVKQSPKRGLAEIVGVLVSVFRQADFRHDYVQARDELHGLEQSGLLE